MSFEEMFLIGPWQGHDVMSLRRSGLIVKDERWPTHYRCITTGNLITLGGVGQAWLHVKYAVATEARGIKQAARTARRAAAKAAAGFVSVEGLEAKA